MRDRETQRERGGGENRRTERMKAEGEEGGINHEKRKRMRGEEIRKDNGTRQEE